MSTSQERYDAATAAFRNAMDRLIAKARSGEAAIAERDEAIIARDAAIADREALRDRISQFFEEGAAKIAAIAP